MLEDPQVWIIGIIAVAVVLIIALFLGRGLKFRKGQDGISLELEKGSVPEQKDSDGVSVGEGLVIEKGARVGNIVGEEVPVGEGGDSASSVEVMKDGTISGSEAGDIVGRRVVPADKKE